MEGFSIGHIVFIVISCMVAIGGFIYGIMEHKRIIDRARKIEPTVRTRSEAEYVLKKDIAQSLGEKNNKE